VSSTVQVVGALVAGLLLGIVVFFSGSTTLLAAVDTLESVGILWVNAIRMTVIPLVISLLFVSVANFADIRSTGQLGARAVLLFVAFLAGSAALAVFTLPALFVWMPPGAASPEALAGFTKSTVAWNEGGHLPTFGEFLTGLVPTNAIRAAADDSVLPVVIFSILFGLAATRIGVENREALVRVFRGISEAMLTIVQWLIALAPVGVFALVVPLVAKSGASAVGAFGYYILAISVVLMVLTLALYPAAIWFGRIKLSVFAKAAFPAQTVALSTRSSLAALPAMLEGAEQHFRGRPEVAGFVLPLAVSAFKVNTPVILLAGACFLGKLYGVPLGPAEIAVVLVASVLVSFGGSGIPMGSLFLMAPIYAAVGLPVEGIGILMALDLVPDIFKTISNVTGDMAVTAILSKPAKP